MEFQVLKRSYLKRNIIIAVVIVLLLSAIILTFTRAKYRVTQSMPLLNGTINYTLADINIVAMYLDGSEIDTLPDGNYELTSESYCTTEDDVRDESIILSYDSDTKGLSVSPMTRKGTKCYLYFEERASAGETILASENAPTNSTTDWTGGTTYYYDGKPNNWVQFGGFYWRIIRINGDGSIRMIYQGTRANVVGTGTQIREGSFNIWDENSSTANFYVGYMYGNESASDYASTHANINSSTIKGILDMWYSNNLAAEAEYIDGNAGFCGDRRVSSGTGEGTSNTDYQPDTRIGNSSPSLSCDTNDVYTTNESSTGNKALTYPIGLISADEAMFAGIPNADSENQTNFLYTEQNYWTMSPAGTKIAAAYLYIVTSSGYLDPWNVIDTYGIRPVINLRADVQITGSGTTTDPFKVVGAS